MMLLITAKKVEVHWRSSWRDIADLSFEDDKGQYCKVTLTAEQLFDLSANALRICQLMRDEDDWKFAATERSHETGKTEGEKP